MFPPIRRIAAVAMSCILFAAPSARAQERFSLFVGSPPDIVDRMVKFAGLKDGEVAVDLGSGDGRIVLNAVLSHDHVRAWGVDINKDLVDMANRFARDESVADRLKFLHGDVFEADLRNVDVIFMWLFPELIRLLRPKILAEAKPGTRIVTNLFDLGSWQADEAHPEAPMIRKWIVPANIAGNWTWSIDYNGATHRYASLMEQQFQKAEGVARLGGERRELRGMRLRGDQISFSFSTALPGHERVVQYFSGSVRGDRIEGTVRFILPQVANQVDPLEAPDPTVAAEREIFSGRWVATRASGAPYLEQARTLAP